MLRVAHEILGRFGASNIAPNSSKKAITYSTSVSPSSTLQQLTLQNGRYVMPKQRVLLIALGLLGTDLGIVWASVGLLQALAAAGKQHRRLSIAARRRRKNSRARDLEEVRKTKVLTQVTAPQWTSFDPSDCQFLYLQTFPRLWNRST